MGRPRCARPGVRPMAPMRRDAEFGFERPPLSCAFQTHIARHALLRNNFLTICTCFSNVNRPDTWVYMSNL